MKSDRELFELLPNSIEDWIDVLRLDGAKPNQQPGAARHVVEPAEGAEASFTA